VITVPGTSGTARRNTALDPAGQGRRQGQAVQGVHRESRRQRNRLLARFRGRRRHRLQQL